MWSVACVVFELLTAEYLFDPQSQGELFGKDDDHCAQIIELLGEWPRDVLWGGRYSREIFDASGECEKFFKCALQPPFCAGFGILAFVDGLAWPFWLSLDPCVRPVLGRWGRDVGCAAGS